MRFRGLFLIVLSLGLLSFYALPAAAQATITVTTTADNTTADGNCSYREAITNANNNAATHADCVAGTGTDTIAFNIAGAGPHTITPTSGFPDITAPVFIDGLTQSGSSCTAGLQIIINGASDPSGWGIPLRNGASGSTVRGLVINGFSTGVGINILPSDNNTIQCNYIGTDATGTSAVGNFTGIFLANGSENNLIGTNGDGVNDANEGNVISGNSRFNLTINGATTTGNHVAGNKIGTDRTGTVALGGSVDNGITFASGANLNIIGVDGNASAGEASEGNLISGNGNYGILFQTSSSDNRVAGNRIGTNLAGTGALANGVTGVYLTDSANGNTIGTNGDGSSDALEGNLISGNTGTGISIAYFSSGSSHSSNNIIAGNLIGTDATGTLDLGNGTDGIFITTTNNLIGTNGDGISDTLERNIISGNGDNGVEINASTASGNTIYGNYIGTNSAGTASIPNADGVMLTNSTSSNFVGTNGDGGGDALEGNLISGNTGAGVIISGTGTNHRVAGNLIGTNATGSAALQNGSFGVNIFGGSGHVVGTNGDGLSDIFERNIISGNDAAGVGISTSGGATSNIVIAGNYIGLNRSGNAAVPNTDFGINVGGGSGHRIGTDGNGTSDGLEGNYISGNSLSGINLSAASNMTIAGNTIGLAASLLADLGNGQNGINIPSGLNHLIGTNADGTSDALEMNVISGNDMNGISILDPATQITIRGNAIGTDSGGTVDLGNSQNGINLTAGFNIIGLGTDTVSNIISGNNGAGISLSGANSTNNTIDNNRIGTNASGASLPNGTNGIELTGTGTNFNQVSDNWIFYHPSTGILLSNTASLGAAGISERNCIYQNAAGVNNTTGVDTFFENNWWGAASGPSGVGTGSGDSVSANVDYITFLTTAPTNCPGIVGVFIDPLAISAVEAGTASYTVMLESAPAIGETVTITMAISGAALGEINGVNPPSLSFNFTSANWNIPQQFDITLNDDIIANGNRSYTAAFTHTSDSTDPASGYDATAALVIDSVDLNVVDNETPNVLINPTAFNLLIGNSRAYDVSLTVEPTTDVTITLTQLDANCTISTTTLTFTNSAGATPWNIPQQVTVTAVGAHLSTCTIQHSPTGGGYTGVVASDVLVNIRRGDIPSSPSAPEPEIALFDPAISKLGELLPGQTGIVGEELEWVVTVSNVGTIAGTNVTITDTLIPALQIDSVNAPGATVTISGQTVTVVYPTLAVGQTVTFSIFTTVLQGATVDNTACVNASNQGVQECASATSGAISQLPSTGETPLWRDVLLAGITLTAVLCFFYLYRKPKAKNN